MAAQSSPLPLVYAPPGHSDAAAYYAQYAAYPPLDGQYAYDHQPANDAAAGCYHSAHAAQPASAVTVVSNQDPSSHQYYGDASAAVIAYPMAYPGEPADAWGQPKPPRAQNFYLSGPQREAVYYESGGASPVSDDSNPAFYNSPVSSEGSVLAEDYKAVYAQNGAEGSYYGHSAPTPPSEEYVQQDAYAAAGRGAVQDSTATYEPAVTQLTSASQPRYEYSQNYPAAYYPEPSPTEERSSSSQLYSFSTSRSDYGELSSPTCYADSYQQSPVAVAPPRTESPMAHLPYQDTDIRSRNGSHSISPVTYVSTKSGPYTTLPQLPLNMPVQHPQPVYASLRQQASQQRQPISIPIPSHSPPLVEDTPKKPLTLACFFCRKRKIACGSPPQGAKDRTCNQCARRKLQCVYPVGTRRSARQREADGTAPDSPIRANA